MEPVYLPLLEDHDFRLSVWSGDGERFVALFRRCWAQMPAKHRQDLLAYWDKSEHDQPTFELSNLWGDSRIAHAQVKGPGYQLRFNATSFLSLPERVALFIIAHELAHAYRWACGDKKPDESKDVSEDTADGLAIMWGFDKEARDSFKVLAKGVGFEEACQIFGRAKDTPRPASELAFG